MAAISAELDARDHVQVENIRQVGYILSLSIILPTSSCAVQLVPLQDMDSLRDLDIGQKRTLICRELERSLGHTRNKADTLLGKSSVTPKCCR